MGGTKTLWRCTFKCWCAGCATPRAGCATARRASRRFVRPLSGAARPLLSLGAAPPAPLVCNPSLHTHRPTPTEQASRRVRMPSAYKRCRRGVMRRWRVARRWRDFEERVPASWQGRGAKGGTARAARQGRLRHGKGGKERAARNSTGQAWRCNSWGGGRERGAKVAGQGPREGIPRVKLGSARGATQHTSSRRRAARARPGAR